MEVRPRLEVVLVERVRHSRNLSHLSSRNDGGLRFALVSR
jgi:hypothetical protein